MVSEQNCKIATNHYPPMFMNRKMDSSSSGHQSSSTANSLQLIVREKTDLGWAHFREDVVADAKKSWTCLQSNNIWRGGGINRMNKHLAGQKRDISPCKKVLYDVQYQMEQSLKKFDERNQTTRSFENDNLCGPKLIELEEEMHTPHTQTKGKGKLFAGATCQKEKRNRDEKMSSYFALKTIFLVHNLISKLMVIRAFGKNEIILLWLMVGKISQIGNLYFLVYYKRETTFVRSVDVSNIVKNASIICNLFNELVQWVGPSNVIHLINNNGANYKVSGVLLHEKYPSITLLPCVAQCLNLILGDIGKMELVSNLAKRASLVTKFVYNHEFLLAWLRKISMNINMICKLFLLFKDSRYLDEKASFVVAVVLGTRFWSDYAVIVGVDALLIHLLCIIDTDRRPFIGYVYNGMYKEKKAIKNIFKNKKRLYNPFTNIHAAVYLLNPAFAYMIRKRYEWWRVFGCSVPNIQNLAIKNLSQTSSSGCERNWSMFERIHAKKRNRLEHQRLNDLVFNCYDHIDYESINMYGRRRRRRRKFFSYTRYR
ncbi:hypothetical protein Pfo_003673 [Paulownia fortunei]|nr:hypothetical protein Pfo_003673 [Paulownia fortunei]